MTLTSQQQELRDHVLRLGREEILPLAAQWDETHEFPWPTHKLLGEQALYGVNFPEEYGGLDMGAMEMAVVLEALGESSACGATMGALETIALAAHPVLLAGTEAQKRDILPGVARGDIIMAFSLTEAESGSDAASIGTRAVRDGDDYVINGRKVFCTLGNLARYVVLFAKTDPDAGVRGISALLVDTTSPGFSVGRVERKMGLRGSPSVELIFDDVRVPAGNLLGQEGRGFGLAMKTLDKGRVAVAADSVGVMRFATRYAMDYARERKAFGKPLTDLQAIQFMLADMEIAIETSRHMTYAAARALDERALPPAEVSKLCAVAKCYVTDVRQKVVSDAIQILGGYGYMEDHPLERLHRDSKIYQIFDGTNQIQRTVIARAMLA